MATHSSVLAWRIPGFGEPGGLLSLGSHRVGHDWSGLAAAAAAVMTISCLHMNMQVLNFQRYEHAFCQHQTGVKWQLALHLLSLLILQFYHLPPPLPSPVSNPAFLVTWHQPVYAPCCTVRWFSKHCTVRFKMFYLFLWVFKVYSLCEKYYKPITAQYYIANCVRWVPRLTLLDLGTNWTYEHALGMEFVCM